MNDLQLRSRGTAEAPAAARRCAVARLVLTDFRCFASLRLETGPEPVALTGPNGAGKTTILEALSFLAPGNGLRRARLDEVARRPAGGGEPAAAWGVAARIEGTDGPLEIGTGRVPAAGAAGRDRRAVRIDGRPVRGSSALARGLGVVWLTPDMDRLFQEAAGQRRRFLDRIVFGVDPGHAERVAAYEKAMRERTRLLRAPALDAAWLSAVEDGMARHGIAAAAARREVTARLAAFLGGGARPFPGAEITVEGGVESWLQDGPALDAEERLRERLAETRAIDAETGGAAAGPHRSDLKVRHAATGRPAAECSTGEQKALLIAVVLAGARLQAVERGALPLLLLDEVAAHLDARHRAALFDEIDALGAQAWYTGTDVTVFSPLRARAQFVSIEDAAVTAQSGAAHE